VGALLSQGIIKMTGGIFQAAGDILLYAFRSKTIKPYEKMPDNVPKRFGFN